MSAPITTNMFLLLIGFMVLVIPGVNHARKSSKTDIIKQISDVKDFKKILRTHNNVLVVFAKSGRSVGNWDVYTQVATDMKGLATVLYVNCGDDKKFCKKLKVSPEDLELKHYSEGEFNKNYDRKYTVKSMANFLRDPKGEIPWDEDVSAQDVLHLDSKQALDKLLKKDRKPILVMFYAPWCGFCKKLKPDYSAAATQLKGDATLAGMDVDKPDNMAIRVEFNITGFPTLCYFEQGKYLYRFGGENTQAGIVSWMNDPEPPKEKEKEEEWADEETEVVHLLDETFDTFVQENPSVMVMFYAPWCGHCKTMKPEYVIAASQLKEDEVEGVLAAVDATKAKTLAEKYKVKGFPTVKYFKDGEEAWDFNERTADKFVSFMKDPQQPPPPPPPEASWEDTPSDVQHLKEDNFKPFLKKKKHTLVMFYAPWCGHCKKAKPEFMSAAAQFQDDSKVAFAAVDCTLMTAVCSVHDVSGYPTFKYFNYGKNDQKYTGGREEADFVNFMTDPLNPLSAAPPPSPSAESQWADVEGASFLHHLTETSFDTFMKQQDSALVMFYAPWCGHCKAMKPAYGEAAQLLHQNNVNGVLTAVDATAERNLATRYQIKGFPTLKYFKNGVFKFDYEQGRSTKDLISFMTNPREAPPPPPETKWSNEESNINHLTQDTFSEFIADKESVLVMFYAPWCGHCKKSKPDFKAAADTFLGSKNKFIAAVDCTAAGDLCTSLEVKGYPTFKYYSRGEYVQDYGGSRQESDFVAFLKSPPVLQDVGQEEQEEETPSSPPSEADTQPSPDKKEEL